MVALLQPSDSPAFSKALLTILFLAILTMIILSYPSTLTLAQHTHEGGEINAHLMPKPDVVYLGEQVMITGKAFDGEVQLIYRTPNGEYVNRTVLIDPNTYEFVDWLKPNMSGVWTVRMVVGGTLMQRGFTVVKPGEQVISRVLHEHIHEIEVGPKAIDVEALGPGSPLKHLSFLMTRREEHVTINIAVIREEPIGAPKLPTNIYAYFIIKGPSEVAEMELRFPKLWLDDDKPILYRYEGSFELVTAQDLHRIYCQDGFWHQVDIEVSGEDDNFLYCRARSKPSLFALGSVSKESIDLILISVPISSGFVMILILFKRRSYKLKSSTLEKKNHGKIGSIG